jgi:hypothetical protein
VDIWPGNEPANTAYADSVSRRLGVLQFITDRGIVPTTPSSGIAGSLNIHWINLRGYDNPEKDFAIYRITVSRGRVNAKVTEMKRFKNRELSRIIRKGIKRSKKLDQWARGVAGKPVVYFGLYYYAAEGNNRSFVSMYDL